MMTELVAYPMPSTIASSFPTKAATSFSSSRWRFVVPEKEWGADPDHQRDVFLDLSDAWK
jgi:hypothetical protein